MISITLMSKVIAIAISAAAVICIFIMLMPTKAYEFSYKLIPGEEFTYEYKWEMLRGGELSTIIEVRATTEVSKIDEGQITLNTVATLRMDHYWENKLENIAYSHVITENGGVLSKETNIPPEYENMLSIIWWRPFLIPIEYPPEAFSMGEEWMKSYTVVENVHPLVAITENLSENLLENLLAENLLENFLENLSAPVQETPVEIHVEERTTLTKREKITTSAGSFDCLVLQRISNSENLSPMPEGIISIERPSPTTFWIDANRYFPIRVVENLKPWTITIELIEHKLP